jgi:hypothetical protein
MADNTWGGARENSGRPHGSKNARQRDLAVKLTMDGGETPFGVMLKTMRSLWKEAAPDGTNVVDFDRAKEACAVAEKAAPYVHPKLNAIAIESSNDEPFIIRFDKEDAEA